MRCDGVQCGFALLEAGGIRFKNTKNILLKNTMNTCIGALVWWACGAAFAYSGCGNGANPFIGGLLACFWCLRSKVPYIHSDVMQRDTPQAPPTFLARTTTLSVAHVLGGVAVWVRHICSRHHRC